MQHTIATACFDLDGTLLNSDGVISAANIQAVRSLADHGIAIVLASGRPIESLDGFSRQVLQTPTYKIGFNGALVADQQNQLITRRLISLHDIIAVTELAQRVGIDVNFSTLSKWINFSGQTSQSRVDKYNETLTEIQINSLAQMQQLIDDRPIQVLKIGMHIVNREKLMLMQQAIQELNLNVFQADREFLEATGSGVSKYSGFQAIAETQHWSKTTTLAFGDYENDYDLVRQVSFGVAMDNGLSKLKAVAWAVAANNDADGVAQVINRYMWVPPVEGV